MEASEFRSPFSPNTDADRQAMLDASGVSSVQELFEDIPAQVRNPYVDLPAPLSELELRREIEEMARSNAVPGDYSCFLGAGSYRQFVPAVGRQIASRGEFMTSYTPYQPEVAQGTLQVTYEFQTLVCQLMGMEAANAGMYDGSTSLAEAALMAARITRRDRIAVLDSVSPAYREVLDTYADAPGVRIDAVPAGGETELREGTAALVVQQPGFLGCLEDMEAMAAAAHAQGALLVVYADPIAAGMLKPPGDYGADIVVAEGQALGSPPSFGGPYVGIFTCREKYLRQMPGRVVGKTVDSRGRDGYVLTLQTREQHIRRERATSNICTSVALVALTATAYMSALGRRGIRRVAELCYHKAHYAASLIDRIPGYSLPLEGAFFREFVVNCPLPPAEINQRLLDYRIIGGLDVSSSVPNGMLLCVTEMSSRDEIESLALALAEIGGGP